MRTNEKVLQSWTPNVITERNEKFISCSVIKESPNEGHLIMLIGSQKNFMRDTKMTVFDENIIDAFFVIY